MASKNSGAVIQQVSQLVHSSRFIVTLTLIFNSSFYIFSTEYDDAKRESYSIREQAREIAEREKERIVQSGRDAYEETVARAKKDMELELGRAKDNLRRMLGELGVDIAERILQEDLSEEQRNKATSDYLDAAEKL